MEDVSMLDLNNVVSAKNLIERITKRLESRISPEKKEFDRLYYWILSRLEWQSEGCYPAKENFRLLVKEATESYENELVCLKHGNTDTYVSQYVSSEEFYEIMKQVSNAFNSMGNEYRSEFFHTEGERNAELHVWMSI